MRTARRSRYTAPLNKALAVFFKEAVTVSLKNPSQSLVFLQTVRNQRRSARLRAAWKARGVQVPPIIILSVTNRCNLHCQGCFHQAMRDVRKSEMSESQLRSIIAQGRDLGASFMVLAGGEPLVRPDILQITRDFPDIIFFLFTNGTLIDEEVATRFKIQRNVVPLLSLEGDEQETDSRRGAGIFQHLQGVIEKFRRDSVFFGVSLTVTRQNFDTVTTPEFVRRITALGGKLLLFAEYTPVKAGSEDWVITSAQRAALARIIEDFKRRHSALFVNVPGDEKDFGGCLSAARGFVHVSAEGDLEPCPFAPYSDANLNQKSLLEALQSPFLKAVRESEDHLEESQGSCALWARREWVKGLLEKTG
jgi:MoaA/NifB/PqqE/SkfB family radical SAM enzyme